MRSRRQFQPTLDLMPSRIAPCDLGVSTPMDPSFDPGDSPTPISTPMDPSFTPGSPSTTDPTDIGPGSYTPVIVSPTTTMTC